MPAVSQAAKGVHLEIVHEPLDPADAARINAMIGRLRSEIGGVASVTFVTGGDSEKIYVVYFTADDHAEARRIASSLGRIARSPYQVMLSHAEPLSIPETIEIRLPR